MKKGHARLLNLLTWEPTKVSTVAVRSGATRELVALRLERVCSVLFTPIHQIRIDNFFGIAEFRYLYGVDTGNQSRSN